MQQSDDGHARHNEDHYECRAHRGRDLEQVRRRTFINNMLSLVEDAPDIEAAEKRRMVEALKAARGRLTLINPDLCRNYLQALAADRRLWQSHLESLAAQPSRRAALKELTRPNQPLLTCYLGPAKAW